MIYKIQYTKKALSELQKLPIEITKRIVEKITFFSKQENPMIYAKKLIHPKYGEYRFRIGDYRVIIDKNEDNTITILYILTIKHRKDIYT
jgi:mRNA interferase RelE/StbE